ncbi:SKU5-like protein [Striga asiatica]|uniref:SKU5-like protein n=1 Tax=Striga asiatica TaxID=4170 RepID=A0A5A7PD30_STRAF|nr:SKU5-like protein [Striga asiatica]
MGRAFSLYLLAVLAIWGGVSVKAEDAYKYFTWVVTYGTAAPLGVSQQVILINGQFPGPRLDTVTNDNIIINVINKLDQPFLLTWNGIKQRKNCWQDGVLGTNCPILPNKNYTYKFQMKDQIGSYSYFPSTLMHRAAGGFGALNIYARKVIPVPYAPPAADYSLLVGDWRKTSHKRLQQILDSGKTTLPFPDALLINGQRKPSFTGAQGTTIMLRVTNIGLSTSINFRIQNHPMKLVEVEGSHVLQNIYDSLDIHVGQSATVLVTLDKPPKDYHIVASTRFTQTVLTVISILRYSNSNARASGLLPPGPPSGVHWSMVQARSFRWNLTSNAARPNPQGSFHYGMINLTRTFVLANSAPIINGKQRYAVNDISYVNTETPLKLADYYNISGVFSVNSIQSMPSGSGGPRLGTSVLGASLHDFVEIVFQNNEGTLQSWHADGYDFWVVAFGKGQWTQASRRAYNLRDALTRHTIPVFPKSWAAILVSLDNQGMWNLRSAIWDRQYLGQQLYVRVYNPIQTFSNEYAIPDNALLCGKDVVVLLAYKIDCTFKQWTILLENSAVRLDGKRRYAVNKVPYVNPDTPLKLADYFNIPGIFGLKLTKDGLPAGPVVLGIALDFAHPTWQSLVVGNGILIPTLRQRFYNYNDAPTRSIVQVYPYSWSAILVSLDNKGMWNLRSANWPRRYLGQELYVRVWNDEYSLYTEYDMPSNVLLCGRAKR